MRGHYESGLGAFSHPALAMRSLSLRGLLAGLLINASVFIGAVSGGIDE